MEPLPKGPATKTPNWVDGSRFSPTPSTNTLPLAYEQPSLIISVEARPGLAELTAARRISDGFVGKLAA
jgi:hypothetical protein